MVARSAGHNVTTNKENATTAASMVYAAKKVRLEMDAMALLEDPPSNINVYSRVCCKSFFLKMSIDRNLHIVLIFQLGL